MNRIDCWTWPLQDDADPTRLVALLADDERRRADAFLRPEHRYSFLLAHAGLRLILARYLGRRPDQLRFQRAANGKPSICEAGALEFNLSHSGGYALCAVGSTPLGVDLERCRNLAELDAMAEQIATPAEIAALTQVPRSQREAAFFRLWVRKEALLKANGLGFSTDPRSWNIGIDEWPNGQWHPLAPDPSPTHWFAQHISAPPGYDACLVAAPAPSLALEQNTLSAPWMQSALNDPNRPLTE